MWPAAHRRLCGGVPVRLSRVASALAVFLAASWAFTATGANGAGAHPGAPSPAAPIASGNRSSPDASATPPNRPEEPTLDVFPAEIAAAGGRTLDVQVRLRAGGTRLTNIALGSLLNENVSIIKIAPSPQVDHLSPGGDHVWDLQLAADNARTIAAKFYVRVDFDIAVAPRAETVHRTLYAPITLASPAVFQPIVMAETTISADPATLVEQRGGDAYLTIKNTYPSPLTVTGISPLSSEYTQIDLTKVDTTAIDQKAKGTVSPTASAFPLRIATGETVVLTYHVTVLPKINPGIYPILLVIKMKADDGRQGILVPGSSVSIGVLGESDLTKLLGVPSFLFLPGFLIIVVWQMLLPIGQTTRQASAFPWAVNSAEFWAVAVVLSLIVGVIYPWLSFGRNYLVSYGLIDLFYVYSYSIVIAIITFGVWPGFQRWQHWLHMPATNDPAIMLLQKMAWHNARIDLRQVHRVGAIELEAFVLEPWSDETTIWLAPRIMVDSAQNPPPAAAENQLQGIVAGTTIDAITVSRCLNKGDAARYWRVYWRQGGAITEPTPISLAERQWVVIDQRAVLVGEPD